MKKVIAIALIASTAAGASYAQTKTKIKNDKIKTETAGTKTKIETTPMANGFSKTPNNLEYKIIKDVETPKPAVGDYIELHIKVAVNNTSVGDSVLYDSRMVNNNKPVPYQLTSPAFKGDLPEGLMLLSAGDSAIFRMPVDSIPMGGGEKPSWFKAGTGQKTIYTISMVSVKSQAQMKKEQDEMSAKQREIDDKILQEYFTKNNIKATKTASGLYYKMDKEGTGENAKAGQKVTVNYTGKTLDGKTFDSNVDSSFNHVQPFTFGLGQGQVIKGWDEGVALLKKGGKATLYIPSPLAYGSQGAGGAIKPNSVLMFDVEVTDISAQ